MATVKSDTKHVRVRADTLVIHQKAQRKIIPARVAFLKAHMDLDGLGTFVGVDKNGEIHVLDGQHRLRALIELGFGEWIVDVKVYHNLTPARESQIWLMLQDRAPVASMEKFKQKLRARVPSAVTVEKIADRYGLEIGSSRDGTIACINRLEDIVIKSGEKLADQTVGMLVIAYGKKKDAFDQIVVAGLAVVFSEYNGVLDTEILRNKLSKVAGGPAYIISHARSTASTFKWPLPRAAAEVIVGIYNAGRRANPLPPLKPRIQGKGKKKSVG